MLEQPNRVEAASQPRGESVNHRGVRSWRCGFVTVACLLILAAAIVTAFFPALEAGFVNWDDDKLILGNEAFRGFSRAHLSWMFSTRLGGHWQPLTWLSYALDDRLVRSGVWPVEAFSMHLTNLVLHVVGAVLFFFVSRRLIALARQTSVLCCATSSGGERCTGEACESALPFGVHTVLSIGALVAALCFAVHPLRAESVAWITERRDVLCMVLLQATTLCYLAWVHRPRTTMRIIALAWFFLALMAKASAMTWPVVLMILDVYPLRRVKTTSNPSGLSLPRLAVEKLPMWVAAVATAFMAARAQVGINAAYTLAEYPIHYRLAQAAAGLVFYLQKTVLPVGLGPLIQIPRTRWPMGPDFLGHMAIVVVATVLLWRWRKGRPYLAAAAGVYVVNLLPVLGFLQSGPQWVADRYSYFSCLGWAVVAGGAAVHLLKWHGFPGRGFRRCEPEGRSFSSDRSRGESRRSKENGPEVPYSERTREPVRRWHGAFTLIMTIALFITLHRLTWRQCGYWRDSLSLWERGVEVCPTSSVAHVQYGCALGDAAVTRSDRSLLRTASEHFRRGAALDPSDAMAWHFLGWTLLRLEPSEAKLKEAETALRRAVELAPSRVEAWLDLADAYDRRASMLPDEAPRWRQAAIDALRAGADACPRDVRLPTRLSEKLLDNDPASDHYAIEALKWAMRADRLADGNDVAARLAYSAALAANGRLEEALSVAEDAKRLAEARHQDWLADEAKRRIRTFRGASTTESPP